MAGVTSCLSVCLAAFIFAGLDLASECACKGAYSCLEQLLLAGWWAAIPWFPPGWFIVDARVGHSIAMWPHPGTCSTGESGSLLSPAPSPLTPGPQFLAHCSSCTFCQKTVGLSHLSRATHTVMRVQTTSATSSTVLTSMATFLGTTWGVGMAVASSHLGQASH